MAINVKQPEPPIAVEVLAESIVKISKAMADIAGTRLTRRAIVALIHDNSKVPKYQIETVLNNLETLESTWLKPKK